MKQFPVGSEECTGSFVHLTLVAGWLASKGRRNRKAPASRGSSELLGGESGIGSPSTQPIQTAAESLPGRFPFNVSPIIAGGNPADPLLGTHIAGLGVALHSDLLIAQAPREATGWSSLRWKAVQQDKNETQQLSTLKARHPNGKCVTRCVIIRLRISVWVLRCEEPSPDELQMPANVELRIASQVLQALLPENNIRNAAERELDVQHALDVARLLLRRFAEAQGGQGGQPLAYSSTRSTVSQAASVDRSQVPISFPSPDAWRASRGLPPAKPLPARKPSVGNFPH